MVKLQYNEGANQYYVTVPLSKVEKKDWDEKIDAGEDVDLDVSFDRDGNLVYRE